MEALQDPRAVANLLIVEIGNSHVSVATAVDGRIYSNERFEPDATSEIVAQAVKAWEALGEEKIKAVAVCSVVPDVLAELRELLSERLDQPINVVGENLHRPLSLAVETPDTVGIDRICSAAAAYEVMGGACVVASFGTAITIDCINDEGAFMGGAIMPGLEMQARALHVGTAQLPQVEIASPQGTFGANTDEAIRLGIIFGAVGGLREIVERYATELHSWPTLVVTGGNAELIAQHCEFIDRVVPDLCLRGVAVAYRKHFSPFENAE